MRTRFLLGTVLLMALTVAACERAMAPPQEKAVTPEEALAKHQADISDSERASRAYLGKLTDAIKSEATNKAWADRKTTEVRASFAAAGFKAESLRTLECKSTLCSAEIVLPAEPISGANPPADAVLQWLSRTEPCAFTTAPAVEGEEGKAVVIHVYINCEATETTKPAR